MSNLTIFKNPNAVSASNRPLSALTQSVATTSSMRRIQTNTNGTFKRIVGGEQIGKAIRGEFNAIIVMMLPKVSRSYYAKAYDSDAKPTLPDCWANLGDVPDPKAPNRQATSCAVCPQNIEGSGQNGKSKACRFQRRVALLLEGDTSGDLYQFNIPAKSLFGKGDGNTHPFESYVKFLVANGESVDYVVTNIAYNLDADTMELQFTPVRPITDEEYELVTAAQADPTVMRMVQLTVAEADGVTATPAKKEIAAKPEAKPAPKANVWEGDDEEDEGEAPAPKAKPKAAKPKAAPAPAQEDIGELVNSWLNDDEDEDD